MMQSTVRADFIRSNAFLLTLAGVLLGVGFAPSPFGVVAFVGFIPLFAVMEREGAGAMQKLRRLYWTFFVFHGVSNWWVSSWQAEADPYLMIAGVALWLGHPFFFTAPMFAYDYLRRRLGLRAALTAFPFLWTAFEWLHSLGELSYPWQALGYTQAYYTPLIQIADVGGVWGVTFLVSVVNAAAASVWFAYAEEKSAALPFAERISRAVRLRGASIVVALGAVLCTLVYGVLRAREFQHERLVASAPTAHIGVIQPNINPWGKWQGGAWEQVALHLRLSDSLRALLARKRGGEEASEDERDRKNALKKSDMDCVIWSETAIPYRILIRQNSGDLRALASWADTSGVAILTGLPTDRMYAEKSAAPATATAIPRLGDTLYFETFNSVMLLRPRANIALCDDPLSMYPPDIPIHRKMKLTPFAERVPYAEAFSFAVKALTWGVGISGWGLGQEQKTLNVPLVFSTGDTARIGAVICIESIYPAFVAEYARLGANLLAVVTNDGWFNHTPGPAQHYMIAAMRAVETKRYVARCGNTGISGFITPLGLSLQQTRIDEQSTLAARLPLLEERTVYTRAGDWLPACATAFSALALLYARVGRRRENL